MIPERKALREGLPKMVEGKQKAIRSYKRRSPFSLEAYGEVVMCEIKRSAIAFLFFAVMLPASESRADIPCSTDLYQVNYEGDTLPEDDPVTPWGKSVVGDATAYLDNGYLVIDASSEGSFISYNRNEPDLGTASAYSMEARMRISTLAPHLTQTLAAIGVQDGEKEAVVHIDNGVTRRITVGLANGQQLEHLVDWEVEHEYKIEVVRYGSMLVYVDGQLVFDPIPYEDLHDLTGGDVGLFVTGFHGAETVSHWDFVRYDICAPGEEVCDGIDNDGDGLVDEDAAGNPLTQSCYTGPSGTEGVGTCVSGNQICAGGVWGPCEGEVLPSVEVWDGSDNNCNGLVDDVPGIVPEAWDVVGSGGGVVEVTNPSSPLFGAKVHLPAGSLSENASVTISLSPGLPAIPNAYAAVGPRVDFRCHAVSDGAEISQFPVGNEITMFLPYSQGLLAAFKTPESLVRVLRFDDGSGAWVELAGIAINRADNMAEATATEISAYHVAIERPQYIQASSVKGTCDQLDFGRVVDLVADEIGKAYFTSLDSNGISFIDLSQGSWGTQYLPPSPQRVSAIAYHAGSIYFGLVTQPYDYSDQEFGTCTQLEKTEIWRLDIGPSPQASCVEIGGTCLEFGTIVGIDVLQDSTIYIAEGHRSECDGLPGWVGSTVKKIFPDLSQVSVVAGTGQNGCNDCSVPPAPAQGTSVQLNFGDVALLPDAMRQVFAVGTGVLELVEANGTGAIVVLADSLNQRVRVLNDTSIELPLCNIPSPGLLPGQMLTVAGSGIPLDQSLPTGVFGDGASGSLAIIGIPASIEMFGNNGIISDLANHVLWAFDYSTCNITRFAGLGVDSGTIGTLWDDGGSNDDVILDPTTAEQRQLYIPGGMTLAGAIEGPGCATITPQGLLVADGQIPYRRIRKISFEVVPLPDLLTPFVYAGDFSWIDVFDPLGLSGPGPHTGIDFDPGVIPNSCSVSVPSCSGDTSGCPVFQAVFDGVVTEVEETSYTGQPSNCECPIIKVRIDYWDPAFSVFYGYEPLGWCQRIAGDCPDQQYRDQVSACQFGLINVQPGDIVAPGQLIGGLLTEDIYATVHFQFEKNGEPLCPADYFDPTELNSILDLSCGGVDPCPSLCISPPETCGDVDTDDDYDGDACEIADGIHAGDPCDSTDADLCNDDVYGCDANDVVVCNDMPGCDDGNPCTDDSCGPTLDCVFVNKPDSTPCDDGNPCTENAVCLSGKCECANYVPDGTLCDDSDACTPIDECQHGSCVGLDPVVCTPLDQCHDTGTCDPSSGICSNPNSPNGTQCDDGEFCTVNDVCTTGNCAGVPFKDSDGDGQEDEVCGGDDCDDGDPSVYLNAPEACDGKDNDCDALTDEDLGTTTCGLGVCETTVQNCLHGVTQICIPLDVASAEVCDLLDNDCNGLVNENLTRPCSTVCGDGTETCDEYGNWIDCTAPEPQSERCNGVDDDCDGFIDEGFDKDGDGYNTKKLGCGGDCNDGDASVNPGAAENLDTGDTCFDTKDNDCDGLSDLDDPGCQTGPPPPCTPSTEQCNGIDDDCDGQTDENIPEVGTTCNEAYEWPWPHEPICNLGTWYCSSLARDLVCISTGGGKPEKCDGKDNNCDGTVDEGCRIEPKSGGGFMSGSSWHPSDCAFLTDPSDLSDCFVCIESLTPYPGTNACSDDFLGCLIGFNDERGLTLGPFPVPSEYPHGTYMLAYNFSSDLETAFFSKITITAQEEWVSQFPLAFDFIAYENDELIQNPDFEQSVFLSQARVERRVVDVPTPSAGSSMTFYFVPQLETRNLAIAIHGLRYYQDPYPSNGDESGCFTALADVTFDGGILEDHTSVFDSDGDGLADDFEISLGMDPKSAAVCELEGLVYRAGIQHGRVERRLARKAARACRAYERRRERVARVVLLSFITHVWVSNWLGRISDDVADMLIAYASAARQALQ